MTTPRRIPALTTASALTAGALLLTACSGSDGEESRATPEVWDSSRIHELALEVNPDDYAALISTYEASGEKVWVTATVTIDGETYDNVGIKLKGNSSLRGMSQNPGAPVNSERPETLPWIIRLDKYVDGQDHEGAEEFVVRANNSETALNEAVALDMLDQAGLAATEAIAAEVSVNGSEPALRLVIENPNTDWMERELGDGYLYKAEAEGDYSYRGDAEDEYSEAWDQEGGEDNLEPLMGFLKFVNESSDTEFAAGLGERLDVDAFATYLAFQTVVDNFDDIDGPGNNSYLYWDPASEQMTVVNWDLNLAFGAMPGVPGGGIGLAPGDATLGGGTANDGVPPRGGPSDRPMPSGAPGGDERPGGGRGEDGRRGGNILAERFMANPDYAAMYEAELDRLNAALVGSGFTAQSLETWTELLLADASHLVPAATITEESERIADQVNA